MIKPAIENKMKIYSFKIEKNYFNEEIKPYLNKIKKGRPLLYQGENNFSIKIGRNGTIDTFLHNGEVNIVLDKCSNKLVNKLEELTKNNSRITNKK